MTAIEAAERAAQFENQLSRQHLCSDTLARIRDVLTRMTTVDVTDYRAIGILQADASFAHICLRVDLGEGMPQ